MSFNVCRAFVLGFFISGLLACQKPNELSQTNYEEPQVDRIIGGEQVENETPLRDQVVYLRMGDSATGLESCGGTLIAHDVVLTAAHCTTKFLEKPELVSAYFGENPLNDPDYLRKRIKARKIWVDPLYGSSVKLNGHADISLILLQNSGENFKITTLSENKMRVADDAKILIAGFGRTKGGEQVETESRFLKTLWRNPLVNENLKRVKQFLLDYYASKKSIVSANYLDNFFEVNSIEPKTIWIDQLDHMGVCTGDSGGPAMIWDRDQFVQIGVASSVLSISKESTCLISSKFISVAMALDSIKAGFFELTGTEFKNGQN